MKRSIRRPACGTTIVEDRSSPTPGTPTYSGTPGLTSIVTIGERPDGRLTVKRGRAAPGAVPTVEAHVALGLDEVRRVLGDDAQCRRVLAKLRARAARSSLPMVL